MSMHQKSYSRSDVNDSTRDLYKRMYCIFSNPIEIKKNLVFPYIQTHSKFSYNMFPLDSFYLNTITHS